MACKGPRHHHHVLVGHRTGHHHAHCHERGQTSVHRSHPRVVCRCRRAHSDPFAVEGSAFSGPGPGRDRSDLHHPRHLCHRWNRYLVQFSLSAHHHHRQ